MINSNDQRHVKNMLECINRLNECRSKYTLEEASNDYMIFDVILMEFENLANYGKRLSNEVLDSNPNLHIEKLSAIRNRIAHDYLSVQIEILYDCIDNDLPNLKTTLENLLN